MPKNLNTLAREIMAKKSLAEGNDPLQNVNDLGPAIVHPLQSRGKNYDSGVSGHDGTIPGANGSGEKFNPDGKNVSGPAKTNAAPNSKDHTIPGSDKAGEGRNPTGTKEKAPGDEDGKPGNGPNKSGAEPYNPTNRSQSVKEDEDENLKLLEAKDDDDDDDKDYGKKSKDDDDKDDDKDDKKKKVEEAREAADRAIKEHVDAMLSGESLTEEFKKKASTIFEAAIAERESVLREELEQEYAESLAEAIETIKSDMTDKVDDYMSYVAKEWLKENEVALETGMRVQIADDFLNDMRKVFIEHHIDIPTEKVSVVEELSDEVATLEDKINEEIEKNVELSREVSALRRTMMVAEARTGLTDVQISKLDKLVEGIDAESDDDFQTKLNILRESYTGQKAPVGKNVTEDKNPASNEKREILSSDDPMQKYVAVARKHSPWQAR